MFTSGWKDNASSINMISATGTPTSYGQLSRNWKINKFELCVEMQYFEPTIENIILS